MRRIRKERSGLVALLCALTLLQPAVAWGYAIGIHEQLTRRALPQDAGLLTPPTFPGARLADLTAFRLWFYDQAASHPDEALRKRFLARYPTREGFGELQYRQLLSFNRRPSQRIWSIDRARPGVALDARELLAASSSAPDRDFRNRDRVEYDPTTRRPVKDNAGRYIPDDPAILNMGKVVGLSSQAHAHYGLLPDTEFSDDPEVLKTEPWRFAVAAGYPEAPILTLAADMTQLHTDLAVLAALWGGEGARYLTVTLVGQAFHYLEDVCNQIHTVQVGLYDFFVDAKLQYWWRAFVTSGGYLTELRKFTSVGVDILKNHHVLIEQLTEKRFDEALGGQPTSPAIAGAVETLLQDDPATQEALGEALKTLPDAAAFGGAITRALIKMGAREGGEAYGLMRAAACGRIRNYGYEVPDDTSSRAMDYDSLVCADDAETQDALEKLYGLQATAFRRATTAIRAYDAALTKALASQDRDALRTRVMGRFLTARLDLLDAADKRRAAWLSTTSEDGGDVIKEPIWPISQALVFLLIAGGIWWRLRTRFPMPPVPPPPTKDQEPEGSD